jgi:hypothetical protein
LVAIEATRDRGCRVLDVGRRCVWRAQVDIWAKVNVWEVS